MILGHEFTLRQELMFDFKCNRGGIKYPYPTTESKDMPDTNPDVGYIDVRFIFEREHDPDVGGVYYQGVELIGHDLPAGTTKGDIEYAEHTFWDEPHSLTEDITAALRKAI